MSSSIVQTESIVVHYVLSNAGLANSANIKNIIEDFAIYKLWALLVVNGLHDLYSSVWRCQSRSPTDVMYMYVKPQVSLTLVNQLQEHDLN